MYDIANILTLPKVASLTGFVQEIHSGSCKAGVETMNIFEVPLSKWSQAITLPNTLTDANLINSLPLPDIYIFSIIQECGSMFYAI